MFKQVKESLGMLVCVCVCLCARVLNSITTEMEEVKIKGFKDLFFLYLEIKHCNKNAAKTE